MWAENCCVALHPLGGAGHKTTIFPNLRWWCLHYQSLSSFKRSGFYYLHTSFSFLSLSYAKTLLHIRRICMELASPTVHRQALMQEQELARGKGAQRCKNPTFVKSQVDKTLQHMEVQNLGSKLLSCDSMNLCVLPCC